MRFFVLLLAVAFCASCASAQTPVAKPATPAASAAKAAAPVPAKPAVTTAAPKAGAAPVAKPAVQPTAPVAKPPATIPATPAAKIAAAASTNEEQLTVISSDKLTFDYNKKYAYFDGNVVVTDPQLKLLADRMTVNFDEGSKVKSIRSEGNVVMIMDDKRSRSDTATYDVYTGEIILEGNPQVTRGKDVLTGKRIIFWRDSNRMKVEGGSTLFLHQDGKGGDGILDGGASGDGK
jgi:lipopolysaccharide export system protein LptA